MTVYMQHFTDGGYILMSLEWQLLAHLSTQIWTKRTKLSKLAISATFLYIDTQGLGGAKSYEGVGGVPRRSYQDQVQQEVLRPRRFSWAPVPGFDTPPRRQDA